MSPDTCNGYSRNSIQVRRGLCPYLAKTHGSYLRVTPVKLLVSICADGQSLNGILIEKWVSGASTTERDRERKVEEGLSLWRNTLQEVVLVGTLITWGNPSSYQQSHLCQERQNTPRPRTKVRPRRSLFCPYQRMTCLIPCAYNHSWGQLPSIIRKLAHSLGVASGLWEGAQLCPQSSLPVKLEYMHSALRRLLMPAAARSTSSKGR